MRVGDWTDQCISPGPISVEAAKAQREAFVKDIMEFRKRRNDEYEAWSSAPIPYDPEWNNPKWTDENPMPGAMARQYMLYCKQQVFKGVQDEDRKALVENTEKLKELGPIIRNPDYKPENANKLPGITLIEITPPPALSPLQKFKAWLSKKF